MKTVGILAANCYIMRNDKEAVVIDPGGDPEIIIPAIGKRDLLYIIDTHGHYDHIAANNALKNSFETRLAISRGDRDMIQDPYLNLSAMVDDPFISIEPEIILEDGDKLPFNEGKLEIISTPGHTKGSICIKMDKILFSGDTLFFHSVGRTDLPTGSSGSLRASILSRLYTLPDDTKVYTGHGEDTLIGEEKKYNDFVRA